MEYREYYNISVLWRGDPRDAKPSNEPEKNLCQVLPFLVGGGRGVKTDGRFTQSDHLAIFILRGGEEGGLNVMRSGGKT